MRRKLIRYDAFEQLQTESISNVAVNLKEAEDVLSKILDVDGLELVSFGADNAIYETSEGTFVHTNYRTDNGDVVFENIEELVIDEESERQESRKILSNMVEALIEDHADQAQGLLQSYLELPANRRTMSEGLKKRVRERRETVKGPDGNSKKVPTGEFEVAYERTTPRKPQQPSVVARRKKGKEMAGRKRSASEEARRARKRAQVGTRLGRKQMSEMVRLVRNVEGYLDHKLMGPAINEAKVQHDSKGNVMGVRVPGNEKMHKMMLQFNWNTAPTWRDVTVMRMSAKNLNENQEFVKAVANLKRQVNLSDDDAMSESIEGILSNWPEVLFLTSEEMATTVAEALQMANISNYDDELCAFMAEGILKNAHNTFVDQVNTIMSMAGQEECNECDAYEAFSTTTESFYPHIDESNRAEMQVYVDLYNALREIHEAAYEQDNADLTEMVGEQLKDLQAVVTGQLEPNTDIVSEAFELLSMIVETNIETKNWDVSNTPHTTVSGDHPRMGQIATHPYSPSSDFSGDWGDVAPVSDGKNYRGGAASREMRSMAWGNVGGDEVFPTLNNPYVPNPYGDYTMRGEMGADKDYQSHGMWSSKNTWPNLQNPYSPDAETSSYKTNHGKDPDLVVDQ